MPAKLKSRIPLVVTELNARMDQVAKAGAEAIEAGAKIRAPDRPPLGEGLVEAIHTEKVGQAAYEVVAGDGDDIFYGHMVEFGTSHSAPYPFLMPAFEEKTEFIASLARASLRNL